MTRIRLLTMLLSGLFILESNALWAAAQQEAPAPATIKEQKQLPPTLGEGKQIYIPGIKPFLWEHHGADPYYPVPDRNALVELSKKPELISDLIGQGFTQAEAEYLQKAFANAKSSDSVITETILPIDTSFQKMRFRHGVKDMVILKGQSLATWQIILPPELGSKVVWPPKVCGNISTSPFLARTETFIFKTEVKERETIKERIVEKPVYVSRPVYYPIDRLVYVDRPVYPVYQEPESSCSRCGKKCKIIFGVLAGAGIGAGVYFSTRGHEKRQVQVVVPYKPPGGGGGVN